VSRDASFTQSISAVYESHLVPLIFEPYAIDLATRVASLHVSRILEIAAGTGVVTRALASALPREVSIVATDLNQTMLDRAAARGTTRPVEWRHADAMALPFADQTFDTVVCQFGVMFFPDKARAYAEARRLLTPGGSLIFNAWDRVETNEFAETVTDALASRFPSDPPQFFSRIPHGYYDPATIRGDLMRAGFTSHVEITTVAARSCAASATVAAIAFCQGTPLRNEIEARDAGGVERATAVAAKALAERFGAGPISGAIQAQVISVVHQGSPAGGRTFE
jgi:SAM-dependent methyltransferase